MRKSTLTGLLLALFSSSLLAAPAITGNTDQGEVLTTADGMSLYRFDKDADGQSNCYETCASNWPPLQAGADAQPEGDFTIIERSDGTRQWAYKGSPLYGFVKDQKTGDTLGDGLKGVWHLVRP